MPLLLMRHQTGSCASFPVALGDFLDIGEWLRCLNTFLYLDFHVPGCLTSVFCTVLIDCIYVGATLLLAPQSPLGSATESCAKCHKVQGWKLNQSSSH